MLHVSHFDWQGAATFIAAFGAFVTVLISGGLQVASFIRQGRQMSLSVANAAAIKEVHRQVNGNTDRLLTIVEKAQDAKDQKAG